MSQLKIVKGDILDYLDNKDLLVNSTNKYMISGSGVCGAIYKAANKEKLEDYCKKTYNNYMEINEIRITPGFDLVIDILHILTPKFHESKDPINDLVNSYKFLFERAKRKNYKNIVSVSIGTGVHGYKHQDIAKDIIYILQMLVKKYNINFTLVLSNYEVQRIYLNHLNN